MKMNPAHYQILIRLDLSDPAFWAYFELVLRQHIEEILRKGVIFSSINILSLLLSIVFIRERGIDMLVTSNQTKPKGHK